MDLIVSDINYPSTNILKYLQSFLKCEAKTCKPYIKGTLAFLFKLESLSTVPPTYVLVTMAVNSLYKNIDLEEGISQQKTETTSKNLFYLTFQRVAFYFF